MDQNMVYILEIKERVCLQQGQIIRVKVYNYWVIYVDKLKLILKLGFWRNSAMQRGLFQWISTITWVNIYGLRLSWLCVRIASPAHVSHFITMVNTSELPLQCMSIGKSM